jgi:adenylate cyclase
MAEKSFKRKLTAMLSADVVGYSRLMRDDEDSTIRTLTNYRSAMSTLIQKFRGHVVDTTGDNLLAEFTTVVDAVNCAVEIQREFAARNTKLSEGRKMEFRIGVNLGDVVEEEGRIYGDGVNIAARMEGLAEAGGVCISGSVYDSVESRVGLEYEYLGEQEVKNIEKPVRAYRVLSVSDAADRRVVQAREAAKGKRRKSTLLIIALIIIGVICLIAWQMLQRQPHVSDTISIKTKTEKPSIAVLPFNNLSDDPEQEYFADGMTDDLITALSKISGIFVISRNSVFTFKGKPVKIQQVAKDLNVHYVLEGSIRRAGDTLRINAQLIDANSDHHLWAEKYDGRFEDVFKLQDNITRKIVSALSVKLTNKEERLFSTAQTVNIEAYDLFLKGRNLRLRHTPESFAEASNLLKKAVELDPNFGQAYAELASVYWWGGSWGGQFWKELGINYRTGRYLAISYIELAMQNPTPLAHQIAVFVAGARRQFKTMADEAQKAIELSPNDSESYFALSSIYRETQPEKSISFAKMVAKLDPQSLPYSLYRQGIAHFFMKNYEKTVEFMERAGVHAPDLLQSNAYLVAALAYLGRNEEANQIYKNKFLKGYKGTPPPIPEHVIHVNVVQKPEMADLLINGLIKAGLPAQPDSYCRLSEYEKLSIEEVKKLAFDKIWTGYFWMAPKVQFWFQWSKNATYNFKYGKKVSKREVTFEDDKFYDLIDVGGRKVKSYMNIYRNPHGSYEQKNEYIFQYVAGAWPFSVENKS